MSRLQQIWLMLFALTLRLAANTEAESAVFDLDLRTSNATTVAESAVFSMDVRNLGNAGSAGSSEFLLDTTGSRLTEVRIVGQESLLAGTAREYRVIWQAGANEIDVTASSQWKFVKLGPGNTGMIGATFYAGETITPATAQIVATCSGIQCRSLETPPFTVTITPRMQAALTATRPNPQSGVVNFQTGIQGAKGNVVVNWDLDGDGQFDDATGASISRDYGTWTGTDTVKVEVIDGAGNRRIEERRVLLNKAPVANQVVVAKPAYDPGGFLLFNPDTARSSFQFDSGRKNSGLVVIVHGLDSDGREPWMLEMGRAIEQRCTDSSVNITPPNIALMDWSDKAKDPSELPAWQKELLEDLIRIGLKKKNFAALGTGLAGQAINFGFDLYGVKSLAKPTGQMLANWIYLNGNHGASPQIDPSKPIHLIGHSAGGFVVGEAARILKHQEGSSLQPVYVDRVTMLDTPFPYKEHIATGRRNFPDPGIVERYISSFYGDLDEPLAWFTLPHSFYRRSSVLKSISPFDTLSTGENGHGYAYVWFTRETIDPTGRMEADGFGLSPIINANTRIDKSGQSLRSAARSVRSLSAGLPDLEPTGWQTFGNVTQSSGTWTFTEEADSGMWQDFTIAATAGTLSFDFHYAAAGDGDFLAVHFADGSVLYQGLDLPLSRDGWIPAEIPLDLFPEMTGKLVFTLISRGVANAQLQVRNIRVTQSEDADSDGLTVAAETSAGTNPRNPDTDGDGLSDGVEISSHGTDPLQADTDGDGQSDAAELAASTNPRANGSVFRVTSVLRSPQGGFVLNWSSVSGKTYRVMRSLELGTGNFETLVFGVESTGPTTTFEDLHQPPLKAFYWIEVE